LFMIIDMSGLVRDSMPICAINPCGRSVTLIVRLMRTMVVRIYGQRTLWKVIFMDYQVLVYCNHCKCLNTFVKIAYSDVLLFCSVMRYLGA